MGPEVLAQPCLGHICLCPFSTPLTHTFTHSYSNTHSQDLTKRHSAPKETHREFSLIDLEIQRGFLPPSVSFFNPFVSYGSRPPRRSRHGRANDWDPGFFLSEIYFASFPLQEQLPKVKKYS